MNSNDKYNMLVNEISSSKNSNIKPKDFGLEVQEFKAIIDEIEYDGLFEKGFWALGGFYIFTGLTFKGRNFLENSDKKEYHKIEKTEVNYTHNISVAGNNNGNIVSGNNNTIHSAFNKNFNALLDEISKSDLENKHLIIEKLNACKDNPKTLKSYITSLLGIGVEASISMLIGSLLSSL